MGADGGVAALWSAIGAHEAPTSREEDPLIETLVAGGPVMIPIGLCSVVALATFLERMWSLRRGAVVPSSLCVELIELLRQDRDGDALTLCRKHNVSVARVIEVAVEARDRGIDGSG